MSSYPHKIYQIAPGLNAVLSKPDLTAKIVRSPDASGDVFIPRTIKHKFKQYVITRIDDEAFYQNSKIESLSFAHDSELVSIGKEVFYDSSLRRLSIRVVQLANSKKLLLLVRDLPGLITNFL